MLLKNRVVLNLIPWRAVNSYRRFAGTTVCRKEGKNHLTRRNVTEDLNLTEQRISAVHILALWYYSDVCFYWFHYIDPYSTLIKVVQLTTWTELTDHSFGTYDLAEITSHNRANVPESLQYAYISYLVYILVWLELHQQAANIDNRPKLHECRI